LNDHVPVASSDDPMSGILSPFWQLVLGAFVVLFVIGPSSGSCGGPARA